MSWMFFLSWFTETDMYKDVKKAYHSQFFYPKAYDERRRRRIHMSDDIIRMYVSWFPAQYPFLSIVLHCYLKEKDR